uniref:TMEM205-like domain-containing protein n=1 Tax=Ciona savignyi TaxID=51511 RepID=H2Y6N9_CIOSA
MFIEKESLYRRLTRFWHVFAAFTLLAVGFIVSQKQSSEDELRNRHILGRGFYETLVFLLSASINLGVAVWVSFPAGIIMFKTLDRHTFSTVQSRLFPVYFILVGVTAFLQLSVVLSHKTLSLQLSGPDTILVLSLAVEFLNGFLNGCFLGPWMAGILSKKIKMEKEEGVMPPMIGSRLGENPEYKKLCKEFGMSHGISTLLNLGSFSGSIYVFYYISTEIFQLVEHCGLN